MLSKALQHKQPDVVMASLTVLNAALAAFRPIQAALRTASLTDAPRWLPLRSALLQGLRERLPDLQALHALYTSLVKQLSAQLAAPSSPGSTGAASHTTGGPARAPAAAGADTVSETQTKGRKAESGPDSQALLVSGLDMGTLALPVGVDTRGAGDEEDDSAAPEAGEADGQADVPAVLESLLKVRTVPGTWSHPCRLCKLYETLARLCRR